MKRLVLSRSAARDLDAIDDYTLEQFGIDQAERLRKGFAEALQNLQRMPESGRERPDLSPPERSLRSRLVSKAFLIVYETAGDAVRVARVLHAARDLPSELLRDDGGE